MAKRMEKRPEPEILDQVKEREKLDSNLSMLTNLDERRKAFLSHIIAELPDNVEVLKEQTKFYLAQGAVAFIEVGRRLIALKETVKHGDWLALLSELNISPNMASRSMRVAQKFGNLKSMLHLEPQKLVALLDVSEEEINEGKGTVLGMSVDAIDAMTVRQLRDKLKEERIKNQKGVQQLFDRDKKLREQAAEIKALKIGPQTDLEFISLMQSIQMKMIEAIGQMASGANQPRTAAQRRAQLGTILHIEKQVALLAHDLQVENDPTEDLSDAERTVLEQTRPDGINWFDLTVFNFLEEATRKANSATENTETTEKKKR